MQVRDGMSEVVLTVGPSHTLREAAAKMLEEFAVPYEAKAMSAHRTPHAVAEWAEGAAKRDGIDRCVLRCRLLRHVVRPSSPVR